MIYPQEMLRAVTSGWLRAKETDGYLFFSRFTARQEQLNTQRRQAAKNGSTAGMCLRFFIPAGSVSFRYRSCPGSSRNHYSMDVYRDDSLFLQQTGTAGDEGILSFDNPSPAEICIWLPCLAGIGIRDLSAPEGLTPIRKTRHILFMGDSITQGYDADAPSLCYTNRLTRYLDAECVNQAIGGDVFFAGNLGEDLIPLSPDHIFIAYGTNDWAHSRPVEETAREYLKTLRSLFPRVPVTVLLPIRRLECDENGKKNEARLTLQEVRLLLRTAAQEYNCDVIDCFPFLPADPALYSDRCLHPNDRGFDHYFEGLKKALKQGAL